MNALHQLLLGIRAIFGGISHGESSRGAIDQLTEELEVSLKKSDRARLLEDRHRIEGDLQTALKKTRIELHL